MTQNAVDDACAVPPRGDSRSNQAAEMLQLILQRQSSKGGFDPQRPVDQESLRQIIEAARWTPTAHNMQNFEIVVVDDKAVLAELGKIQAAPLTEQYLLEHLQTLSFSEEELLSKKTGLLGTGAPESWRDPSKFAQTVRESPPSTLAGAMKGSPCILMVVYNPSNRAPGSENDFLGVVSLGCLMENVWLASNALGIGVKIQSAFGDKPAEEEVRRVLGVPASLRVAFGICLGYPTMPGGKYLRVRRDSKDVSHHNRYGTKL